MTWSIITKRLPIDGLGLRGHLYINVLDDNGMRMPAPTFPLTPCLIFPYQIKGGVGVQLFVVGGHFRHMLGFEG